MKKSIAVLLFASSSLAASSQTQVTNRINFDGPPDIPANARDSVTNYFETGMSFTPIFPIINNEIIIRNGGAVPGNPNNGSRYVQGLGVHLTFSFTNGSLFSLMSADLAGYNINVPNFDILFVGYQPDGNSVSAEFKGSGLDFRTVYFNPMNWSHLSRVEIPGFSCSLDNLVIGPPMENLLLRPVLLRPVSLGGRGFALMETAVPWSLTNVVAVSAGGGGQGGLLNLALQPDGTVVSLGDGRQAQTVPVANAVAVAAGVNHGLALLADGTVAAWGGYAPAAVTNPPSGLSNVVAIAAAYNFSLALRLDGTVVKWPTNDVPTGLRDVVAIAAGGYHSLALKSDGSVVAWNSYPQGATDVPADATNAVAIAAGGGHSLVLRADGTIVAWGSDWYGETDVPPDLTNAVAISAGGDTSAAVRSDGTVEAWGYPYGSLTTVPAGPTNVVAISVGFGQDLALVGDAPPRLEVPVCCPSSSSGRFNLAVQGQSGRVYRLEYRDSLAAGDWTPLPLVAGRPGQIVLTDEASLSTQRFYRVRRW